MKFVLIPDSFKGTLSSEQICEIAKEKVEKHFPGAETACVLQQTAAKALQMHLLPLQAAAR